MPGKRLSLEEDATILRLHEAGKSYCEIARLTHHSNHTVSRVLAGRPTKRGKRKLQTCENCSTTTSKQYFREGGKLLCIECAGRARLEANERTF